MAEPRSAFGDLPPLPQDDAPAEGARPADVGLRVSRALWLAVVFTVAALLSLYLSRQPTSIAGIWFANAVAVAVLATSPRRHWPELIAVVALAVPLANWLWGDKLSEALSFVPANLLEIAIGGWLLQRQGIRSASLVSAGDTARLLLLGAVVPQIAGATVGALTVTWHTDSGFAAVWAAWFASSTIGAVSLLPLALLYAERGAGALFGVVRHRRFLLLAPVVVAFTAVCLHWVPYPFIFILLPLLVAAAWAGVASVTLLTALASLVIALGIGLAWIHPRLGAGLAGQVAFYFAYAACLVPAYLLAATMAELRESRRRLTAQAQALQQAHDGLEQFVRFASHDLREPLNGIVGLAGLLQRDAGGTAGAVPSRYLVLLTAAAERMRRLVDDMLAFTRAGQLDREAVYEDLSLDAAFAGLRQMLQPRIDATSAQVEIGPLGRVPGHPTMLPLVFQNLLGNALKFVRHGRTPHVRVSARRQGDQVEIRIADNGIGIDPAHRDKLFEPFGRLNPRSAYEGTGLGLALARQIVVAHGGSIGFESEPGQGTTFWVRLPLVRAAD